MKKFRYVKKPVEVKVIEVTKAELKELLENNSITISDSDAEWIAVECGEDEFIGYVAGEIENLDSKDKTPFLWFINRYYFQESYKIKEEK